MPKYSVFLPSGLAMLFFASCNQPFDPRAPFQQQMVVFSIFSTDRNVQFVRVERNYMPADFDPLAYNLDNSVENALVTIKDGADIYRFRDTTLPRSDTSRFKFPLHAYACTPFSVQFGKSYEVTVQSPQLGAASASVTVPARGLPTMALVTPSILDDPSGHRDDADIIFNAVLSNSAKGFVGQLYVDYDVLKGTEWSEERVEVPLAFAGPELRDLRLARYPELTARTPISRVAVAYKNDLYRAVLRSVSSERYRPNKLIFNRIVYQFLQADKNLFNYYSIAHSYRDAQSMRLDEPMYSNVSGGVGLVGAYALDSLVHLLPENFVYNNR